MPTKLQQAWKNILPNIRHAQHPRLDCDSADEATSENTRVPMTVAGLSPRPSISEIRYACYAFPVVCVSLRADHEKCQPGDDGTKDRPRPVKRRNHCPRYKGLRTACAKARIEKAGKHPDNRTEHTGCNPSPVIHFAKRLSVVSLTRRPCYRHFNVAQT
jgi:hypothetical protein